MTYPERQKCVAPDLDLLTCKALTFDEPDINAFPCLEMARICGKAGGTACPVMNGANEAAVALFLDDKIGFYDIFHLVKHALDVVPFIDQPSLDEILESDRLAREAVLRAIS